jgi:hypothetical protein
VAVLIYATTADLAEWTQQAAPANAASLLRSASLLVREATKSAYYAVDANNLPTDTDVLEAFRDSTCAQAAYWIALGIDPTTGGLSTQGVLRGKRIGSAALDYDTSALASVTAMQERMAAARELCDEAFRILQIQKLQITGPWIVG